MVGRFINADDVAYLGADGSFASYNLFAYCKNNPVMYEDPTGRFGLLATLGLIAIGGIIGGTMGALSAASTGGNVIEGAIEGSITGMISSTCGLIPGLNAAVAVGISAIGASIVDLVIQSIEIGDFDPAQIDIGRVLKTGFQAGLGTAIPPFGDKIGAINAIATGVICGEVSTLITFSDIIITNAASSEKSSSSKSEPSRRLPIYGKRRLSIGY